MGEGRTSPSENRMKIDTSFDYHKRNTELLLLRILERKRAACAAEQSDSILYQNLEHTEGSTDHDRQDGTTKTHVPESTPA